MVGLRILRPHWGQWIPEVSRSLSLFPVRVSSSPFSRDQFLDMSSQMCLWNTYTGDGTRPREGHASMESYRIDQFDWPIFGSTINLVNSPFRTQGMACEGWFILGWKSRCLCPTSPNCSYVTFYGKRDFADVVKDLDLKRKGLTWIIWVDPIS